MDVYDAINTRRTIRDFEARPVPEEVIKRILAAGLKAPTNNHLRQWEFVIVNDRAKRAEVLNLQDMTDYQACEDMMDFYGMVDKDQRGMYHIAMPKQFSMLFNCGCLILPFFKLREPLSNIKCLSDLNEFASIWLCIENILLAAAAEGVFGVTRIPMTEETEHIKKTLQHPEEYFMPCYIALGYPAKDAKVPVQKQIKVEDRMHFNKW